MLKCEKKDKIIDLLTKLRKKKICLPHHINLYRVRYDVNKSMHIFNYLPREDYSTDIFSNSKNSRT